MDIETKDSETQDTEKKSSEVSSEKVENLIQDTTKQLEELKVSLKDKATEVEELHNIALEQEKKAKEELAAQESKIKELQEALDVATKAKEEAIAELNNMKEEALLNKRIRQLHDLKLLRSGEEAQIKQAEKIKFMTEEEFAEYVEDLSDIQGQASSKSVEPAEDLTSKTVDQVAEQVGDQVADEQAKAKLREILTNLKSESVEAGKEETEKPAAEKKEVAVKETASTSFPDVELLQKAFLGILKLKNSDK